MIKNMTLTGKLILGGILAVAVSVASIGFLSATQSSKTIVQLSLADMETTATTLADMVQMLLTAELNMVKEIAVGNNAVDTTAKVAKDGEAQSTTQIESLTRKLKSAMDAVGANYESIAVIGKDGKVFADGHGGQSKGLSLADRDYFQNAMKGQYTVGSPVLSKNSGKIIIPLAGPVIANNEVVGVTAVMLKIDHLVQRATSMKLGKTGYVYLVDKTGTVVAHRNADLILKANMKDQGGMEQLRKAILAGETGAKEYSYLGESTVAGYAPIKIAGWSVIARQSVNELNEPVRDLQQTIAIIGAILLLIVSGLILVAGRRLSKPIAVAVSGLMSASRQVASAASQISSTSQQLAEGASEQAASIEETSSSLEEMSSMTRQNASHSAQANGMMTETTGLIMKANTSMNHLTVSMEGISKASEEISRIIRTIDEIAFQTNLLALNAAVEAARAGEAGAGFAVVADEVRNLAMRAADAAKNTATLIEGTVKSIREGSEIVTETASEFSMVAGKAEKMGGLISEISAASNEQAQGIEQINKAVNEMDKVVQQNAASAEESASASEELNAQAEQMKGYVQNLMAVVGGSAANHTDGETAGERHGDSYPVVQERPLLHKPQHVPAVFTRPAAKTPNKKGAAARKPEEVIPFGDTDNCEDF
ncbi:MAG: methyl-accepting chemotaxis protein [Desulfobacteraceae bacterium]|nr:methyl-accepting chemotaxis protein [Desulfobacteraceae bacterium]